MHISRRGWLLAAACWTEVLRGDNHFVFFDAATAVEIKAIAEQIIPGAGEAGVIWFIDRALAGYDKDKRELYQKGLRETTGFAALRPEQQLALLKTIEKTEFFQQVRLHTLMGFYGKPERMMHYEPPFGYYDA